MKNLKILILILASAVLMQGCSNENPVNNNEESTNSSFVKVFTAENSNIKFEVWSATASTLRYAYNKVGFKVFENNQEKTSGFVKFLPKMYHWENSPMHSTGVKTRFDYSSSDHLFTGYVDFFMYSDSLSTWYGFYNYNDQLYLDSVIFNVNQYADAQVKAFSDFQTGMGYFITLVKPYSPQQGMNTFQCMLHRTNDYVYFEEVDDAQMLIMPWMEAMGHGSPNNVHPECNTEGIYEGKVNLNMPGQWAVYDTVYYQNRKITPATPPKFIFNP